MDLLRKRKIFIPIIFLGLCRICPLYAQMSGPTDSAKCRIEVICEFTGLDIWLNGQIIGRTPMQSFQLKKGLHFLRVAHPDPSDWLQRDWEKNFFIRDGETKRFNVTFPSNYWLSSDPSGASIFIGERWIGSTPSVVHIPYDSLGWLALKKAGYEDYRFEVSRDKSSIVHVQLQNLMTGDDLNAYSPRLTRKWILMGGIVAVLCGGIGYYFKAKSDRAFDNYLSSSHPKSMNRHYSDSVTFDRYAGVFYGMAEVSLGLSLYFFIRSMDSK